VLPELRLVLSLLLLLLLSVCLQPGWCRRLVLLLMCVCAFQRCSKLLLPLPPLALPARTLSVLLAP